MDFFGQQERARKQSGLLIVLFALAVIVIVAAVNFAATLLLFSTGDGAIPRSMYVWISFAVLLVIAGGALFRIMQLRGGGAALAEMLGGRRVDANTPDRYELINIVEEMALAAGVAVPPVFVLDREEGINAFAAGWGPNEAVVAVTRGTMKKLKRDELQGVIAHEFSHILNGDMRLNLRLIGLLNGLLVVALIGRILLNFTPRRRQDSKGSGAAIALFGLALVILGYIGVLFGQLIQAAVSRQREYLADASAVQFTRNPDGIGLALRKIGAATAGSRIDDPHAEEAAHCFFAKGVASMFASHPPLEDRIRAIYGRDMPFEQAQDLPDDTAETQTPAPASRQLDALGMGAAAVVAAIGNPARKDVDYAMRLKQALPLPIQHALRTPAGAMATVYAVLLNAEPGVRERQLALLDETHAVEINQAVRASALALALLDQQYCVPLVDLATPCLKQLGPDARAKFLDTVVALAAVDRRISAREFVIMTILERRVRDLAAAPVEPVYGALSMLVPECQMVLSLIARVENGVAAATSFEAGWAKLELAAKVTLLPADAIAYQAVRLALDKLNQLAPLQKPRLIKACVECILANQTICLQEAELVRAVCAALDSPLPPVLEETPLVV
jgi:Zn-dependent protease with chaperone function